MEPTVVCSNCEQHTAVRTVLKERGKKAPLCQDCYAHSVILNRDGQEFAWYTPQPHQRPYHESNAPNLLAFGTRGTGKSVMMRKDAIIRCMLFPGFKALVLRRTIPDLRKSHLRFINAEMKALGDDVGYYRETTHDVVFKNGSFIQFSHCETLKDVENYLSSEWDLVIFDELSTFTLEMFLTISAAARSPEDAAYKALVRGGSNPIGIGAAWMKQWFIDHDVNLAEYPDYLPEDFEMQFSTLQDNKYVNRKEYEKRLRNLPDHLRRAYLLGEFVVEGAYFTDFIQIKVVQKDDGTEEDQPWHVIQGMPTWLDTATGERVPVMHLPWLRVYRSIDWGYSPDPAVCHWHVVLPNKRKITFKERTWKRTLAKDVALAIKKESEGMRIVESFSDPTMFIKTGNAPYSIGEIFEQNGVPLTPSQNDRELYGYSVHEMLNTILEDGLPSWQILKAACPELVRTIPILQTDPKDARRIADGPDHWVISCAYFAMGGATPSRDHAISTVPRWMLPRRNGYRNVAVN